MNLMSIAVKNIRRNLFRTVWTVVGVGVSILGFLVLRTTLSAWGIGAEYSAKDRLATRNKVTFMMLLPKRYADDVRKLEGVQAATWFNWFGGTLPGKEDRFFATMAVDAESFLEVYDELSLSAAEREGWLRERRGAIVGATLAKQFGWKIGDRVVLTGSIFPGQWEFEIAGIYAATRRSIDQSSFYFHWKYLNENLPADRRDEIGWIASKVPSAGQAAAVSQRIDALFEPRDIQTLSMSERAMQTSFLGMVGALLDALQIVSLAILLIMMLVLGNTIAMGVRERTREYGLLRAIGFMPRHVSWFVIGEASTLGVIGGAIGVGLGYPFIERGLGRFIEENATGLFPYFRVSGTDAGLALALSLVLAALAAVVPAYRASSLEVTEALRKLG